MSSRLFAEQAERQILGGVLFQGEAIDDVIPVLPDGSRFLHPGHQVIYAAMVAVRERSGRPDLVTVAEEMHRSGTMAKLAANGCEAYLSELCYDVVTTHGIADHARLVKDKSILRRLAESAERWCELAKAGVMGAEEALGLVQQQAAELADTGTLDEPKSLKAVLNAVNLRLKDRVKRRSAVVGIPTGLIEYDEMSAGLQSGHLIIWAGRPSMGKSALALCALLDAAFKGYPSLVFSEEMEAEELGERALSMEARIDNQSLRTGLMDQGEWSRALVATTRMKQYPVRIDDCGRNTLASVCAKARKWRRDKQIFTPQVEGDLGGLGLIVLDYLQLLGGDNKKRHSRREEEVSSMSRGLKNLARELKVPVLALSQLNRSCESREDKRPMKSDLRESGAIEQDADAIAFIYRDEVYHKESPDAGTAEIILDKQRGGRTGMVRVVFEGKHTKFLNMSKRIEMSR